ncbi:MAG: hypothetical protein JO022_13085 [Acidobacteriaceae bacterium]|nr:hypothetical protein [Acidobacteriaceae bacterium]
MVRLLAPAFVASAALWSATLPTPEQFAGFRMGTDKKLLLWDKIVDYMKLTAASSPRVKVEEVGKTSMGRPFLAVTISSPETVADLNRYKENQRRLAYPRDLDEADADKLIQSNKAVLFITCNIHGSEIGSTQMVPELVYRLATEDSPEIKHILDNVIFVLIPSLNPDGQYLISDWYMQHVGTQWENSPLPDLYHKYAGHDNNRDAFMNTQIESKHFNKLAFKEWFPVVYLDQHQMGNMGARIFVPPFMNPINMNVDPTIWELNGMFGYAMGSALHAKGYTGIINDTQYTSWWQGGFMMQVWWHNAVGLLTEVASANVAGPTDQERARPSAGNGPAQEISFEQMRNMDPRKPLPPPRDITPRNTYPRPWMGGHWTLRNIVDYELTATYALLNSVANERLLLQRNFYRLNRKEMELGKTEGPFAYVIPAGQHDPAAAALLVRLLDEQGGEVQKATEAFQAGGRSYAPGSYVVLMSQPFRPFVKDLLEKQTYPVQRQYPGGPVQRPYDVTGWTLPLQMGVEAVEVTKPFTAKLEKMSSFPVPEGKFEPGSSAVAFELSHNSNNAVIATNRLLKAGAIVNWTSDGGIVVRSREDLTPQLREIAKTLGVDVKGLSTLPPTLHRLKAPRVALYYPPQGVMDEGWTRWLLEQYEFPYSRVRPSEIKSGNLRERFDAIILSNQPKDQLINGATQEWIRPDDRGGIGADGVAALKQFVRDGGSLVALGSAGLVPVEEFPLPLKNALKDLKPDQFSCPGSILKVFVDNRTAPGYGMQDSASAVFYNNIAFDTAPAMDNATVHVIARYPSNNILQSGWIGGEEHLDDRIAAAQVDYGKGHVILLGFAAQNRAQPHGTFKLLFNSLHFSAAEGY